MFETSQTKSAGNGTAAAAVQRLHFRGTPVRVTVSCGITELNPDDAYAAAFDRADAALYRAKSGGKNLCVAALPPAPRYSLVNRYLTYFSRLAHGFSDRYS